MRLETISVGGTIGQEEAWLRVNRCQRLLSFHSAALHSCASCFHSTLPFFLPLLHSAPLRPIYSAHVPCSALPLPLRQFTPLCPLASIYSLSEVADLTTSAHIQSAPLCSCALLYSNILLNLDKSEISFCFPLLSYLSHISTFSCCDILPDSVSFLISLFASIQPLFPLKIVHLNFEIRP